MKLVPLSTFLGVAFLVASPVAQTSAASHGMTHGSSPAVRMTAHASPRTTLFITPSVVTVGQRVTLSVVAPFPSVVRVTFRSLHHAFTGMAVYQPSSRSYVDSVYLIPRVHATEQAQVVITITPQASGRTSQLIGHFVIRGEAAPMSGIPQYNGGDGDADNNGAPSDGDGDR